MYTISVQFYIHAPQNITNNEETFIQEFSRNSEANVSELLDNL